MPCTAAPPAATAASSLAPAQPTSRPTLRSLCGCRSRREAGRTCRQRPPDPRKSGSCPGRAARSPGPHLFLRGQLPPHDEKTMGESPGWLHVRPATLLQGRPGQPARRAFSLVSHMSALHSAPKGPCRQPHAALHWWRLRPCIPFPACSCATWATCWLSSRIDQQPEAFLTGARTLLQILACSHLSGHSPANMLSRGIKGLTTCTARLRGLFTSPPAVLKPQATSAPQQGRPSGAVRRGYPHQGRPPTHASYAAIHSCISLT